jgi:DNA gyrase/topoisomerase IV subunit A
MGRPARGVRAMDLEEGDYLVGAEVVEKEGLILSISENGFGKRTPLEDYRLTARGGKGVINMKTTPADRQGGRHSFREGRFRPDDHHQARQDHPH